MTLHYAALRDTVCLEAQGADAAAFLHAQLSRAVADLGPAHAPLAGWSDARGRVRALLRVCRLPDRWLLVTPRDGADELATKLRMFVLRAKVTLAHAEIQVAAVLGHDDEWLARQGVAPDTPPNGLVRRDDVCFIRVSPSYWQLLGPPRALAALGAGLEAASEADTTLEEVRLGIPAITRAVADRYVAQMLNLDELGAVSFDKGCYPGQEIIARVHNLGGVKRRARRYAAEAAPPAPGTPVLEGSAPVGEIIRSAAAESGSEMLAVVDHGAATASTGALRCGDAALRELPLPFAVSLD
jgi:tRNA-modifying protein YgfZ